LSIPNRCATPRFTIGGSANWRPRSSPPGSDGHSRTAAEGGGNIAEDKAEVRLIRCGDRTKSHSATVRTRTMSSGAFLTEKPQEDWVTRIVMQFDCKTFCIDCFAHHAEDGDCSAQAKSTRRPTATPAKRTTRATSIRSSTRPMSSCAPRHGPSSGATRAGIEDAVSIRRKWQWRPTCRVSLKLSRSCLRS
jgi:hypothetical protein